MYMMLHDMRVMVKVCTGLRIGEKSDLKDRGDDVLILMCLKL